MKLTTKLLLGATMVAGLSVSAFAACASNISFGSTDGVDGKKITNLANGTGNLHAVNYQQTLRVTQGTIVETNSSALASSTSSTFGVQLRKMGRLCQLSGLISNVSGSSITTSTTYGVLPEGYRPMKSIRTGVNPTAVADIDQRVLEISSNGNIKVRGDISSLSHGSNFSLDQVYFCN